MSSRALIVLGLAGCAVQEHRLELPDITTGHAILLLLGDDVFGVDVGPETTIDALRLGEVGSRELIVFNGSLEALQLTVDDEHRLLRGDARELPRPVRQLRWADEWVEHDDGATRASVRLPAFDAERCIAHGGCFAGFERCELPCPAPLSPVPPAPPAAPLPPAPPELSECPPHAGRPQIFGARTDCVPQDLAACATGQVRAYGSDTCAPLSACPPSGFASAPATWYVAPNGSGDGRSPGAPLATIADALRRRLAGEVISLSVGQHASPAGIVRVVGDPLIGACAGGTTILGRIQLGAGGSARDLRTTDGAEVSTDATRTRLERVILGGTGGRAALEIPSGAALHGEDVYVTRSDALGPAVAIDAATLSLSRWGTDGGSVGLQVVSSSVTASRGVVARAQAGASFRGGQATVRALDVLGGPSTVSVRATEGASVDGHDLLVDGEIAADGAGTSVALRRARMVGVTVEHGARLSADDARLALGRVRSASGSELILRDVLRWRTDEVDDPLELGSSDGAADGAHLSVRRGLLLGAPLHVFATATASVSDVRIAAGPVHLNGVDVAHLGRLDAQRVAMSGVKAGALIRGVARLEDLRVDDGFNAVHATATASVVLSRVATATLAEDAVIAFSYIEIADIHTQATNLENKMRPALYLSQGADLRRARVRSGDYDIALQIQPASTGPKPGRATHLEDIDLQAGPQGGLYLSDLASAAIARVRIRGQATDGVYVSATPQLHATDLDIEQGSGANAGFSVISMATGRVERFRVVGGALGARLVMGSTVVFSLGRFEGQGAAALSLSEGTQPWELLDRVTIVGPAPRLSVGE